MKNKKTKGFTLIEMIITVTVLIIIMAMAGSALHFAMQSYRQDRIIQERQYDARLAMLSISREIRRGVDSIDEAGANVLKLKMKDGSGSTAVEFNIINLGGVNYLNRVVTPAGSSPVNFIPVAVESFEAINGRSDGTLLDENRFVTINMVLVDDITRNEALPATLRLSTTLSLRNFP